MTKKNIFIMLCQRMLTFLILLVSMNVKRRMLHGKKEKQYTNRVPPYTGKRERFLDTSLVPSEYTLRTPQVNKS